MRTPAWCRERAEQTGPATASVVAELLGGAALHRLRSAQAILRQPGAPGLAPAVSEPGRRGRYLDRLINTSHQAFMNGPSYRPNERPKAPTTAKA